MQLSVFQSIVPGGVNKPPPVDEATLTSTSVLLTWNPPEDPNGAIVNYRINVQALSSDPTAFMMGMMGGGGGDRRRKRQTQGNMANPACITGGQENIARNFTTGNDQTTYRLNDLSTFAKAE